MGFWWRPLGVLASVLLGALFLRARWGWVAALGFLAGIQAFVMLRRLWQEFRLARWLENPDEVDPPDATGTWGDIFYRLQKLQRRQKASRGQLTSALEQFARVKSAEMLAVGWLESKLPEELEAYRHAMKVAHMVIREAFSNTVITPGKTTSQDVVWWMRQLVAELGLGSWFQPSITIRRKGGNLTTMQGVIQPGDMLHTDFGIVYMGFSTDTQHNAYVLKTGETVAPQGLKDGLKAGHRLQDLTIQYAKVGRTGNQALADALAHAKKEGLVPPLYCHAIGYHGHGRAFSFLLKQPRCYLPCLAARAASSYTAPRLIMALV